MVEWRDRRAIGDRHEQRVMHELSVRGWSVHACGQGTYPVEIRHALSRTDSALRQFPDMIAARGAAIVAIDAKTKMPSTTSDRYAISVKCVTAGLQFLGTNAPVPLYYVFGNLTVLTPAEVAFYGSNAQRATTGSYYLVQTHRAHPFDEVFGLSGRQSLRSA